jgi:hypothetical protein
MQVITPFATRVLTGDGAFQARFVFYAAVQAVAALIFLLMIRDIRRYQLIRADTPLQILQNARWRATTLAAAFLISIPVCFVNKAAAYGCWAANPVLTLLAERINAVATRRRAGRTADRRSTPP